jgi:hypothetical protein
MGLKFGGKAKSKLNTNVRILSRSPYFLHVLPLPLWGVERSEIRRRDGERGHLRKEINMSVLFKDLI